MADEYHWSDPAMTTVAPAPDDAKNQISMDAAGNKPPKDGLASMRHRRIVGGEKTSPEVLLYGDKPGDE